jgi:signal transduction histidine kinase
VLDTSFVTLMSEVDHYLNEAERIRYDDPKRLLELAHAAADCAQALGDFRRYGRALVYQAWASVLLNHYELSLSCALEVLALAHDYHLMDIEALAVGVIGFNFVKCGILEEAGYLFEHQASLGRALDDQTIQARGLNDLAVVKMELGDYQAAVDILRHAVSLMPDVGNGLDKSMTHLNLAFACVKTQQFDEAIEHAGYVLVHAKDSPKTLSDAHLWIASSYLGRGELAEARVRIAAARACVTSVSPPIYNDNLEGVTADLLVAEGRCEEAAQVWEYMYDMAMQREELDYAISALQRLKQVYERLNNTSGLISAYKRLAEDVPARQQQSSNLRFRVLRLLFTRDKASLEAELRLSQQKTAILQRLSHEFRTPLTVIQSSAEIIERYADRMTLEDRQARLQRITGQVKWMTVMLDDILQMLQMDEQDDALFAPAPFTLAELVDGALSQLQRYQVSTARVNVEMPSGQVWVQGAPQALQTILVHLLTNAVKFSSKTVWLNLSISGNNLVMRVMDEGIGIPLEEQEAVFKPLVRGSNLDEVSGSGLGLTIVAKLVRRIGGRIDLDSMIGKGTKITICVPIRCNALPPGDV